MTAATTTHGPQLPRHPHRGPHPRGAARAGLPRRRRARARAGRGHHRVGGRDVRRPVLHHLLDGRRRARPPGRRGSRRASTWSSSTPATTSPRPSAPRDAVEATLRRQPAARSRPCRRSPSRTRRTARTSTRPTPTCAARCARCSRWPRRSQQYDAWATGLRRAETHNRVIAPVVGWDAKKGKVKVSPLARWTDDDVERYIDENGVLVNPLGLRRLPLHRLLALHAPGRPRRGPAQRTLGRHRQDRVRDPLDDPLRDPQQIDSAVGRHHHPGSTGNKRRPH